jgi:predicted DsbA family dithiol-disulfide isomerase
MARSLGMTLRLPPVQPRSRKALEAAEYARGEGRFDEMHEALFRAFFEDGKDIGREEVLLEVGASVGLDREGLMVAIEEGRYTETVIADEELARRLGVSSVPTMFVGLVGQPLEKAEAIVGAQPYGGRIEAAIEGVLSRR